MTRHCLTCTRVGAFLADAAALRRLVAAYATGTDTGRARALLRVDLGGEDVERFPDGSGSERGEL